jgi:DNA-binding transcriptional MerR regulator
MEGNGNTESAVPAKNLLRIGEVSRLTSTKQFVLRYWETEFPMLQPVKSPKGHRLYRREDIDTVFTIRRLLYDEGFTIAGARRHLREQAQGASSSTGRNVAIDEYGEETGQPVVSPPVAALNRKVLLDLRDSLRSLLTVLESE